MRTRSPTASASAAAAALVLTELAAPRAELGRLGLVARLLGLPHLARELLDLPPHVLGPPLGGPPRRIGLYDGIHLGRLDAAAGQRGLDDGGIVTQGPDIDHSTSK